MKNVVLLTAMLLSAFLATAQEEANNEERKIRFGFNFGAHYSNLYSHNSLPENAEISNGIGFGLGVLMDYSISEKFMISPKSELSFYNSSVDFAHNEGDIGRYEVFPAAVNVMVHFAYKTGKGKVLPYFFAGPNYRIPVSLKNKETTSFNTNPDFAVDFGFGLENRLQHFIFAPELKYSFGFLNVNQSPLLQNLSFHTISLVLNFK